MQKWCISQTVPPGTVTYYLLCQASARQQLPTSSTPTHPPPPPHPHLPWCVLPSLPHPPWSRFVPTNSIQYNALLRLQNPATGVSTAQFYCHPDAETSHKRFGWSGEKLVNFACRKDKTRQPSWRSAWMRKREKATKERGAGERKGKSLFPSFPPPTSPSSLFHSFLNLRGRPDAGYKHTGHQEWQHLT